MDKEKVRQRIANTRKRLDRIQDDYWWNMTFMEMRLRI